MTTSITIYTIYLMDCINSDGGSHCNFPTSIRSRLIIKPFRKDKELVGGGNFDLMATKLDQCPGSYSQIFLQLGFQY